MSQISKYPVEAEVYNEVFNTFLQTIAGLTTKDQVLSFFIEFLTSTERIMFSKRLAVGLLIAEGCDYKEIRSLLKMSTATISRFSAQYKYGKGYRQIVDKIKSDKEVSEFLRNIGEKISDIGTFGGKGSPGWREINKTLKARKSKLL